MKTITIYYNPQLEKWVRRLPKKFIDKIVKTKTGNENDITKFLLEQPTP